MAGLEGTLKTPFGAVQKKTALLAGGGLALLLGIVWYRQKQMDDNAVVIPEAEINPATGFPYGSAEDAAALAQQAGYISPPASGGNTGGGSGYPSNIGYVNNGQWTQAVVEYMVGNGLVDDPAQLSAALGKYITGAYCTETDKTLIQQAIAAQGFPPVASPNGYPPSINTTNPSPPPTNPPPTGGTFGTPSDLKATGVGSLSIAMSWKGVPGAVGYDIHRGPSDQISMQSQPASKTSFQWYSLKPNTVYTFSIVAKGPNGQRTKSNVITQRTHTNEINS